MLSFYFTSLSFKQPLKSSKRLFIRIELPDGSAKLTETKTYTIENNIAVFSESFGFPVASPVKIAYFSLEIFEENLENPNKRIVIGKTTLHTSPKLFQEVTRLTLSTCYQTELTLCFELGASDELKEKITNGSSNKHELSFSKPAKEQKDEGLSFRTGQIDFLKLGPIFYEFVWAVSPIVLVTEKLYSFFTWANPHETLLYSGVLMMIYFYYRGLAIVFFIIFFRYSSLVIASAIKAKPLKENAETKLQIYKRNLLFIQHCMELVVQCNEYYKKIFHDYDKTAIMEIFLKLKRFSLILAFLLVMYSMNHLIFFGYWGFLLYNTSYGKTIFMLGYEKAEIVIDLINSGILNLVKAEKLWNWEYFFTKESYGTLETVASENLDTQVRQRNSVPNKKTFVTYENQRWWIGKGWCHQMLIGERSTWSDSQGNIELTKESFQLPEADWRWQGNWEVTVTPQTDQDGWEYAIDFSKGFHSNPQVFDYVRRRRWMRTCVQEDDSDDSN